MDRIYKVGLGIIIVILIASNLFLLSKTKSQYKSLDTLHQMITQVNKERKNLKQQLEIAESEKYLSEEGEATNTGEKSQISTDSGISENISFRDVSNEFAVQLFTFKTELLEEKRKVLETISTPSIVDEIIPRSMIDEVKKQAEGSATTTSETTNDTGANNNGKESSDPYFETAVSSTEVYMLQEAPNIAKSMVKVEYQTKSKNNLAKTVNYVECSLEKGNDNKILVKSYKVLTMSE